MTRFAPVLALMAALPPVAAWADCPSLAAAFSGAVKAGDVDAVERLAASIETEPTCRDDFRARAKRAAGLALVKEAQWRIEAGARLAEQASLLERALRLGRSWQALAMLGDRGLERKAYDEASGYYQEALGRINDARLTPRPPPKAVIAGIFNKAAESRMLARDYVSVPVNNRSGAPEGLALTEVRGWKVESVPIPITFETASDRFTGKGRKAAEDLVAYLKREQPREITIVGHTDERGADAYNQDLSKRRADSVARHLRENGFRGPIRAIGRGETEPLRLDDPGRYTREERWRLNRRVELRR